MIFFGYISMHDYSLCLVHYESLIMIPNWDLYLGTQFSFVLIRKMLGITCYNFMLFFLSSYFLLLLPCLILTELFWLSKSLNKIITIYIQQITVQLWWIWSNKDLYLFLPSSCAVVWRCWKAYKGPILLCQQIGSCNYFCWWGEAYCCNNMYISYSHRHQMH